MEDFDRAAQRKMGDTTRSVHLAYHMFLSTRDMARLGDLMLRGGNRKGRQLVPRDWVALTTKPATRVTEMHPNYHRVGPFGYGYIWWVWDGAAATGPFRGAYTVQGAIGQFITVLPAVNLLIAQASTPEGPWVYLLILAVSLFVLFTPSNRRFSVDSRLAPKLRATRSRPALLTRLLLRAAS